MTPREETERLAALFRRSGFVFSMTVDPEGMMRFALSCDAEDDAELCRRLVASQYPMFAKRPELIKCMEVEEDAECVIARDWRDGEACRSRAIGVMLDPNMFDVAVVEERQNAFIEVTVREPDAKGSAAVLPGFLASMPSEKMVALYGTGDFVLVQTYTGGFWDGSTALMNGFSLPLAPDMRTYQMIFDVQAAMLRSRS